jgi:predicted nucleic acid-binding protein
VAKKLKVYLDTSVPNAYFDERNPVRQETTREFWGKLEQYEVFVSNTVIDEIKAIGDEKTREELLELISNFRCLESEEAEVRALAKEYIAKGVIPVKHIEDAIHIAVASVNSLDVLVSWNFEHIVKLKTKREVNVINVLLGYNQLEIIEPSML